MNFILSNSRISWRNCPKCSTWKHHQNCVWNWPIVNKLADTGWKKIENENVIRRGDDGRKLEGKTLFRVKIKFKINKNNLEGLYQLKLGIGQLNCKDNAYLQQPNWQRWTALCKVQHGQMMGVPMHQLSLWCCYSLQLSYLCIDLVNQALVETINHVR